MSKRRSRVCTLSAMLLIVVGAWLSSEARADLTQCSPAPEIKAALQERGVRAIPHPMDERDVTELEQFYAQQLKLHPTDLFVHLDHQNFELSRGQPSLPDFSAATVRRTHRASATALDVYLAGRLLAIQRDPEARPLLERALSVAGASPWPHFSLIYVYTSLDPDAGNAAFHMRAFIDACPEVAFERLSLQADSLARRDVDAALPRYIAALRSSLELEPAPHLAVFFPLLWRLELSHRIDRKDTLRRIHADIRQLLSRKSEASAAWYETVLRGLELLGDDESLASVITSFGASGIAPERAQQALHAALSRLYPHPDAERLGATNDGDITERAFDRLGAWLEVWPDDPLLRLFHLHAISSRPEVGRDVIADHAEDVLSLWREKREPHLLPPVPFQIAEVLLSRRVKPASVPDLAQAGLSFLSERGVAPEILASMELKAQALVAESRAALGVRDATQSPLADIAARSHCSTGWVSRGGPLPSWQVFDERGQAHGLAEMGAAPGVVALWAAWCGVCRGELGALEALHQDIASSDLRLVTLNIDEDPSAAWALLARESFSFPVYMTRGNGLQTIEGAAVPLYWIVDRHGVVRWEKQGRLDATFDAEAVRSLLGCLNAELAEDVAEEVR